MWSPEAVLKRVKQSNKDYIIAFCGPKGTGKSYSCIRLMETIDPRFDINRIVFTAEDFIKLIKSNLPKGSAILFDEIGVEFASRQWWSILNKIINNAILLIRTKRLIIGLTIPMISMLDSMGRSHIVTYVECKGVDKRRKLVKTKLFYVQVNARYGDFYYKYYRDADANPLEEVSFGLPSKKLIKDYEAKRAEFLNKNLNEGLEELITFREKEKRSKIANIDKLADEVYKEKDKYLKEVNGKMYIDWRRIMRKKHVGHIVGRQIGDAVQEKIDAESD